MKKSFVAALAMSIPLAAQAAFLIEQRAPTPEETLPAETPEVDLGPVFIKATDFRGELLVGFGRDITLWDALGQIVPKGWELELEDGAMSHIRQNVSWRGGTPWTDTLRATLQETALVAVVDPSIKSVRIYPRSEYLREQERLEGGSQFVVEVVD